MAGVLGGGLGEAFGGAYAFKADRLDLGMMDEDQWIQISTGVLRALSYFTGEVPKGKEYHEERNGLFLLPARGHALAFNSHVLGLAAIPQASLPEMFIPIAVLEAALKNAGKTGFVFVGLKEGKLGLRTPGGLELPLPDKLPRLPDYKKVFRIKKLSSAPAFFDPSLYGLIGKALKALGLQAEDAIYYPNAQEGPGFFELGGGFIACLMPMRLENSLEKLEWFFRETLKRFGLDYDEP